MIWDLSSDPLTVDTEHQLQKHTPLDSATAVREDNETSLPGDRPKNGGFVVRAGRCVKPCQIFELYKSCWYSSKKFVS